MDNSGHMSMSNLVPGISFRTPYSTTILTYIGRLESIVYVLIEELDEVITIPYSDSFWIYVCRKEE